jgi:hypothetical protein
MTITLQSGNLTDAACSIACPDIRRASSAESISPRSRPIGSPMQTLIMRAINSGGGAGTAAGLPACRSRIARTAAWRMMAWTSPGRPPESWSPRPLPRVGWYGFSSHDLSPVAWKTSMRRVWMLATSTAARTSSSVIGAGPWIKPPILSAFPAGRSISVSSSQRCGSVRAPGTRLTLTYRLVGITVAIQSHTRGADLRGNGVAMNALASFRASYQTCPRLTTQGSAGRINTALGRSAEAAASWGDSSLRPRGTPRTGRKRTACEPKGRDIPVD